MKFKSGPASRCLLILGYLMIFWTPVEVTIAPVLTTLVVRWSGPEWLNKYCENSFERHECNYLSYSAVLQSKLDASPCPPCLLDIRCQHCMAANFADVILSTVFLLTILSFRLSPYEERTMWTYYTRIILLLITGLLGIFDGQLVILSTFIWGPILMLTRKLWFPIPGDRSAHS
jgi:hypothetical protein